MDELKCCSVCGRDTRARDGICGRCLGHGTSEHFEQRGRKIIKIPHGKADLLQSPDDGGPQDPYQGDSIRDDL